MFVICIVGVLSLDMFVICIVGVLSLNNRVVGIVRVLSLNNLIVGIVGVLSLSVVGIIAGGRIYDGSIGLFPADSKSMTAGVSVNDSLENLSKFSSSVSLLLQFVDLVLQPDLTLVAGVSEV